MGPIFRTSPIKRGDLVAAISAAGTVEPEAAVDMGAQVAGVISAFGKDRQGKPINWGSVVETGTVLARIDDSLYAAALETAKAQLQQNEANKVSSEANVLQMKANLAMAEANWKRAQRLGPSDALAQSAYDQYQASYEVAKANLAAAQAAVNQAIAAVAQAKANLTTARINVDYCTIKSPVKGVVIDRRVNIGQTVVSSLSAPSLFLIANDLKRIQVWVSVNEADIGSICQSQPVTFTVDAYPNRVFHGTVGQVRLNATMTQNVVTYTVEVDTNNDDGKLLPYLTANAKFQVGRRHDVLMVPNGALRWSPRPGQIAPDSRQRSARKERGSGQPMGPSGSSRVSSCDPCTSTPGSRTAHSPRWRATAPPRACGWSSAKGSGRRRTGLRAPTAILSRPRCPAFRPEPGSPAPAGSRPRQARAAKSWISSNCTNPQDLLSRRGRPAGAQGRVAWHRAGANSRPSWARAARARARSCTSSGASITRPPESTGWMAGRSPGLTPKEQARLRNRIIGFVFQNFNLLPRTSALENVLMPLSYSRENLTEHQKKERAVGAARKVGLADRIDHQPSQLSGGEQQRVAIARSLINRPEVLFADEPTGNLDSHTSEEILEMFQQLNKEEGITIILVTHDPGVAHHAQRTIRIKDGLIEGRDAVMRSICILKTATGALRRNIMRTLLTTLGIVIGVAAVITMMEIGNGAPSPSSAPSRASARTRS